MRTGLLLAGIVALGIGVVGCQNAPVQAKKTKEPKLEEKTNTRQELQQGLETFGLAGLVKPEDVHFDPEKYVFDKFEDNDFVMASDVHQNKGTKNALQAMFPRLAKEGKPLYVEEREEIFQVYHDAIYDKGTNCKEYGLLKDQLKKMGGSGKFSEIFNEAFEKRVRVVFYDSQTLRDQGDKDPEIRDKGMADNLVKLYGTYGKGIVLGGLAHGERGTPKRNMRHFLEQQGKKITTVLFSDGTDVEFKLAGVRFTDKSKVNYAIDTGGLFSTFDGPKPTISVSFGRQIGMLSVMYYSNSSLQNAVDGYVKIGKP